MLFRMLDRVQRYLLKVLSVARGEPLWAAVSGGMDSMVLLHVLRKLGHPCRVVHIDHGLRGEESNDDRLFVEGHCRDHGIPIHIERVDVASLRAEAPGASVQMAARALRYGVFQRLVESGPSTLALAHHKDDAMETFLIHLMRGMGLHGWGSIPPRTGAFIRPLMEERRAEIEAYAARHGIPFRADPSNTDPKYLRNRVRHELLPLMESMRPGAGTVLARNIDLMRELEIAAGRTIDRTLEGAVGEEGGTVRIPIASVLESGAPLLVLHQLLQDRGAHPEQLKDIVRAMEEHKVGTTFPMAGGAVLIDRNELVVHSAAAPPGPWTIPDPNRVPEGAPLRIERVPITTGDRSCGKNVVWLDEGRLEFPLELRVWRTGDRMRPIGLGGSKLISDILIDAKVPRDVKDRTLVLVSGGHIAWLCGHRAGEGFQAKKEGGSSLRCELVGS